MPPRQANRQLIMSKGIDNREVMAYLLFRRFRCSRDEALAAIDELSAQVPAVKLCAEKRWRPRPPVRKPSAPEAPRTSEGN
jgi:hypothetical protein